MIPNGTTSTVFLPEIQPFKDSDVVFMEATRFCAFRLMKELDRSAAHSQHRDVRTSLCLERQEFHLASSGIKRILPVFLFFYFFPFFLSDI
jgi:hypothetical protein